MTFQNKHLLQEIEKTKNKYEKLFSSNKMSLLRSNNETKMELWKNNDELRSKINLQTHQITLLEKELSNLRNHNENLNVKLDRAHKEEENYKGF